MMRAEFDTWLEYHFARFPADYESLTKFPEVSAKPAQPTQSRVLDAWYSALKEVDLRLAKEATDLLAKGSEEPAKKFGETARRVAQVAFKIYGTRQAVAKSKIVDGQEVFTCKVGCRDSGLLTIWHPKALMFFLEFFTPAEPPRREDGVIDWQCWFADVRWRQARREGVYESAAVKCSCPAGVRKSLEAPVYDPQKHVLYDHGDVKKAITRTEAILSARGGF